MRFHAAAFTIAALLLTAIGQADEIASGPEGFRTGVRPFFKQHCIRCHGPEVSKGGLSLHALDADIAAGQEPERWGLVLDMLEAGAMPPEDEPQPPNEHRAEVARWIESGLEAYVRSAAATRPESGTRRLTSFEYQNTMRDLLGFELNLAENLPEDPLRPYHFNNTAEFMLVGPEQLDRYAENARRALASAIVDPTPPEVHRTRREWKPVGGPETGMRADEVGIYGNRRNTAANGMGLRSWPTTGEFRIRVQAGAILPPGIESVPLQLSLGYGPDHPINQAVGIVELTNTADDLHTYEFRGRIEDIPQRPGQVTAKGQQRSTISVFPTNLYDDGRLMDRLDPLGRPRLIVRSIEFEAPVADVWPPAHHTRILFDSPLRTSDPEAYVRAVLEEFLSRAFRRPVTADELDRFATIYALFRADTETLEQAMRETLAMALISPQFLYHTRAAEGVVDRQYEFASRLAYFLWGSMPDEELLTCAVEGRLDDADVIERQVLRLLADARSRDFVENFTTQWLSIDKAHAVNVNLDLFPRFLYTVQVGEKTGTEIPNRPTIRDHLRDETVAFIAELIRRNASLLAIVDSDFAMLNRRLAAHYGVDGVQGTELRAVPVREEHRLGGVLTHGSVLLANSTGSAPHPIYRAVWLREAILGEHVKDPPAEVPALSDTAGESADTAVSIKDLLALHRQKESCNDCHVRLDPWGIPFERYNAIGQYQPVVPKDGTRVRRFDARNSETYADYQAYLAGLNTVEVEAASKVPHGPDVDGLVDLKAHLMHDRKDDVIENVLRRLLAYGIGRELTYHDRFEVRRLFQRVATQDFAFRDLIVAVCQSDTFRGVSPKED